MKKITWPISLPVGYMLREHVNRVRFPDWPNFFFYYHLKILKMNLFFLFIMIYTNNYLLYLLTINNAFINNKKVNLFSFIFL